MRKLSIFLILVFVLAGCAAVHQAQTNWSSLSPKAKSTAMWQVYSGQYDQYLIDFDRFKALDPGPVKTALATSLQARKKGLIEAEQAIRAYDSFVGTGLIPVAQLEAKALEVLGRIGGM
jgi:hypothetical protein